MFSNLESTQETEHVQRHPSLPSDVQDFHRSVSIIVPTLNEAENIDRILGDLVEHVREHFDFEIIVADGGSTDGTREHVARWAKRHPVRLVSNDGPGGLAEDVLAAAAKAKHAILVVLDADGSHPASSIPDLVRPVSSGDCDMAIGSRYVDGGRVVGWPLRRRTLSQLGAAFASPFTDVKDPLSGFFAVRRACLLAAGGHAEGFKIGLEAIFAGGDTLTVSEIPISFSDRIRGTSKIGASQFAAYLKQLMRFARGTSSAGTIHRFAMVGMAGLGLDVLVVSAMRALGADITLAHISGFCFATVFNYLAHAKWSFEDRGKGNTRLARFMLLSTLALAMRGGFIAAASDLGLPFFLVVLMGIAGGGGVSYIGNEFYVFRSNTVLSPTTRWRLGVVAVAAYVVALRIVCQGAIDLMPQEAYYWNYAQRPDWGYLDHPPMVAWLIWLGTSVFGDSEFGVRISATSCWLATAFFVFRFAHNLFGRTSAVLALLLLSILPFFFAIGLVTTPDAPLTAAWAGALYFLERALIGNRETAWLSAGVCIGLGMLSKYTIALLGPATIVFLIVHPASRRWFLTKWPYLCAILAIALFSPVIAWNATHDWASFQFQGSRRWLAEDIRFSTPALLNFIAQVLGPIGLILAGVAIVRLVRLPGGHGMRSPAAFITVFTLVPLSVFLVFSLLHTVKLNWTGPVWLALLPAMANAVATTVKDGRRPRLVAALKAGTATSVLSVALFLHYLALGLPFVGYSGTLCGLPIAWEEFVSDAERIGAKVAAETGQSPLLVGMDAYTIASELGFYGKGRTALTDITSRNLFGRNGLMFGVWASDIPSERSAVILYGLKESSVSAGELEDWFENIGPVRTRVVRKNNAVAGRLFYRIGYGFRRPD
ncbi:glycosyltransferase family 39 protein [Rhizobium sp. TRM95111]|uniref:glycosyltransferase family 39 protein n=1 Tax=Rhizobium alarense TaxID=2846851 RepID=UPI001F41C179|nr:glycosyltransferase family 39 protein [Rhizobium alarense]